MSTPTATEAAISALEGWAAGRFPSQAAEPGMRDTFREVLRNYAQAFEDLRAEDGDAEALRKVLAWAMQEALGGNNDLTSAGQIRAVSIPDHLARNAARHHIIRTVAHAVLGWEQAIALGIYREWNN